MLEARVQNQGAEEEDSLWGNLSCKSIDKQVKVWKMTSPMYGNKNRPRKGYCVSGTLLV